MKFYQPIQSLLIFGVIEIVILTKSIQTHLSTHTPNRKTTIIVHEPWSKSDPIFSNVPVKLKWTLGIWPLPVSAISIWIPSFEMYTWKIRNRLNKHLINLFCKIYIFFNKFGFIKLSRQNRFGVFLSLFFCFFFFLFYLLFVCLFIYILSVHLRLSDHRWFLNSFIFVLIFPFAVGKTLNFITGKCDVDKFCSHSNWPPKN